MSAMSESARSKAKSKAERLVKGNSGAVDASGWREPTDEHGDVQTGMRVLSRRAFRRGGKVAGEHAAARADRRPRKAGGALTADSLINRNVKTANEERDGTKHEGGLKRGGHVSRGTARAHKFVGGPMMGRPGMPVSRPMPGAGAPMAPGARPMMRAAGGKVHKDEAQDRALIHKMGCACSKCSGGRVERASGGGNWIAGAIKHPGALHKEMHVPEGKKIPAGRLEKAAHSKNSKLAARARLAETLKGLPHKASGGAIPDGTRPAGGRLARKEGGRAKKGMNVNIIIAPGSSQKPPMPPPGALPPPGGGPVGLHQAAPPPMPPGAGAPMGAPPMPMARKSGGRAYPIESGAGGGLGRLEKIRAYG
jgi:hypothetical protein